MTLESQSIQHLNQREQDLNSYIDGTHGDNELNDNPLITMGIHSKYYDIGNVSMMKNLFAKKHSEDQLISLHINIQSLSAKYEALKELIKTLHLNSYIDGTHGDNELNDNPLITMGIHSK